MVRVKNRYLLVNILYPNYETPTTTRDPIPPNTVFFNGPTTDALTAQTLVKAVKSQIASLFGDYGAGAVAESLHVKYISPATSTFILRVSRSHYQLAWAALFLLSRVPVKDGKPCVFRVVRVSGTMRKAEEEAIRRARLLILRAHRDAQSRNESSLDAFFGKKSIAKPAEEDIRMIDPSDDDGHDDSDR